MLKKKIYKIDEMFTSMWKSQCWNIKITATYLWIKPNRISFQRKSKEKYYKTRYK